MRTLPLLLLVGACAEDVPPPDLALSPADGQSDVGVFQELHLMGELEYPDEAPVPQVIQVLDVTDARFVAGHVERRSGGITFVPDAPWAIDRTYAWTVSVPATDARIPVLALPETVLGTALFHTDNRLEVLAATRPPTGELCLITSRVPFEADLRRMELSLDGRQAQIASSRMLSRDQLDPAGLPEDDPGLGGVCLVLDDGDSSPGAALRATVDGTSVRVFVEDTTTEQIVRRLRREIGP